MKQPLKETYERMFGPLNEAAKGLKGYEKYVAKMKGEILFYAESPNGHWFLGANNSKNKYHVEVGQTLPPSGAQISAIEGGDSFSSPNQAKSYVKQQMKFAKQGYVDDGNKFSFKVHINKLEI